ncbi:MAG: aldehyde dehydrogenase [Chitinophagales bacterium]|nr:aldehyde dehydrogenase [Chitinophagales bacterium]
MVAGQILDVRQLVAAQKSYFKSGATKSYDFRLNQLKKLRQVLLDNEQAIVKALYDDLHKSSFEAYGTEFSFVLKDLDHTISSLKAWMKRKKVTTPLFHQLGSSWIQSEPYGLVYVMAPWNYPFQLLMAPVIGAMAAGNTIIMKPSQSTNHICAVIEKMVKDNFSAEYMAVVTSHTDSDIVLEENVDYVFFTGGKRTGIDVYTKAAKTLTPVTLELGGKSPCFIDESVNMNWGIKRIIWGKFTNAGQTCVAPDYVLIDKKVKAKFLEEAKKVIKEFYGDNPKDSKDFGRIVKSSNNKNFKKLASLLEGMDIVCGGEIDESENYIAPTILDNVKLTDAIMQDEIFGPILPIVEYNTLDEAIQIVKNGGKPLALYIFSENKMYAEKILSETSSGNASINECLMHVGQFNLPFGGVGDSGIGQYHGKLSFDTFSHAKGVLKKSTLSDLKLRFPPYKESNVNLLKKLIAWLN